MISSAIVISLVVLAIILAYAIGLDFYLLSKLGVLDNDLIISWKWSRKIVRLLERFRLYVVVTEWYYNMKMVFWKWLGGLIDRYHDKDCRSRPSSKTSPR